MKSNLVDLTMLLHHTAERAARVSDDGDDSRALWLPLAHIEIAPTGRYAAAQGRVGGKKYPVVIVTLPEWLAIDRGLV